MTPNDLKRREVLLAGRAERVRWIQAIQAARESKVVCIMVSDRTNLGGQLAQDMLSPFAQVLDGLLGPVPKVRSLDIWLYGPGGEIDAACALHGLLEARLPETVAVNALVPFKAHSAMTFLALGAHRIVMSATGNLSPIDSQVHKHEPGRLVKRFSVEDIRGLFTFATELIGSHKPEHLLPILTKLLGEVDPTVVGMVGREIRHSREMGTALLSGRQPRLARRKGLPKDPRSRAVVEQLSSLHGHHGHPIFLREAKQLGLNFAERADPALNAAMWQLYLGFARDLDLEQHFLPSEAWTSEVPLIEDRFTLKDTCVALLETEQELWAFFQDLTFLRQRQGQVTINMGPVQLQVMAPSTPAQGPAPDRAEGPPGSTGALPPINMKQIIDAAVRQTIEEQVRKAMESVAFQVTVGKQNVGWTRVVP